MAQKESSNMAHMFHLQLLVRSSVLTPKPCYLANLCPVILLFRSRCFSRLIKFPVLQDFGWADWKGPCLEFPVHWSQWQDSLVSKRPMTRHRNGRSPCPTFWAHYGGQHSICREWPVPTIQLYMLTCMAFRKLIYPICIFINNFPAHQLLEYISYWQIAKHR